MTVTRSAPGATRALLLRHITALADARGLAKLHGRTAAKTLGLSASTVKHAMSRLVADGVLRRVKRGENNKPSLYQIAGVGSPVVVRKPAARRKAIRVAVVAVPVPAPVSQTRPPDNPLRRVPPGTFATGGFSMIGGRL